mmetsp:Transcript_50729/g.127390  ORF Transcript_50729/g.127390 Transcript_50729/m.127390 type:complete len:267 (+) Transcript_50729:454-1254(+)
MHGCTRCNTLQCGREWKAAGEGRGARAAGDTGLRQQVQEAGKQVEVWGGRRHQRVFKAAQSPHQNVLLVFVKGYGASGRSQQWAAAKDDGQNAALHLVRAARRQIDERAQGGKRKQRRDKGLGLLVIHTSDDKVAKADKCVPLIARLSGFDLGHQLRQACCYLLGRQTLAHAQASKNGVKNAGSQATQFTPSARCAQHRHQPGQEGAPLHQGGAGLRVAARLEQHQQHGAPHLRVCRAGAVHGAQQVHHVPPPADLVVEVAVIGAA